MNLYLFAAALSLLDLSKASDRFDCTDFPDLNNTYTLSFIEDTPPSKTNLTYYFNPCGPVGVPGCAADDHLCGFEYIEVDGNWKLMALKSYGSASNGAEFYGRNMDQAVEYNYMEAVWGDDFLYEGVLVECAKDTEFVRNHETGRFAFTTLSLKTPALCGFHPVEQVYYAKWRPMHIVALVLLIGIMTLAGGLFSLWLFLKFSQRRGELSAEVGLWDALYDVISALSSSVAGFFSRYRSLKR